MSALEVLRLVIAFLIDLVDLIDLIDLTDLFEVLLKALSISI